MFILVVTTLPDSDYLFACVSSSISRFVDLLSV